MLDPVETMAAAVHDVRGSVGSIRLALTSVLDDIDDGDVEFRRSMLSGAEAECRRLNASLTALPAIVAAGVDSSAPAAVDLRPSLEAACEEAGRRQVNVKLGVAGRVAASVRAESLAPAIAALCIVVGDGDADVVVSASEDAGRARLTVARADGGQVRWDRAVIRGLADSIGADLVGGSDGVELLFERT